ncbi:TonB-dependent receptor [Faecalibacter rhinopitheci]|uniref:TonB-dependent receptor n=1 Tax=Faecalibacter rhinopitheci TaxID=2779678 RepID=A0A8J7FP37_9FLAO|nr:TonB-dependent receptor [Faecalibacter rhinopitheci]MBF0596709.1 TonB-dependent receptor [Faecalibacter rhinopitheci]
MRLTSLFTLFFSLFVIALNAQDKFQLKGKVLSTSNAPIEFTSVTLETETEGVVMEGMADANGLFVIEAPAGKYVIIIEPLGYDIIQKEINLTSNLDLGTFSVKVEEVVSLGAAVITAQKPIYKVELDKKVYDMASDPMSQGQSLSDALQNVPSVQVDAEGGVSLRGNDNVKFLIDGKPSGMLGVSDVGEALKNIPAENVERIEVITNPSSRYEASGSAGIINIVLKKGTNTGFNGSVTVNGGIPEMAGINVNLNYKTKKFNWFANAGTRYSNRNGEGSAFRTNFLNESKEVRDYMSTDRTNDRIRRNYNVRLGTEYYINDNNTVGISAGYRYNNGNNNSLIDYLYYNSSMEFLNREYNLQDEKEIENNFDVDVNYKHEFDKKGHELMFTGRFSSQKEDENGNILNYKSDNSIVNRTTDNLEEQTSFVFTGDYVRPIGEKGKFELGGRVDLNNNKSNNRTYKLIEGNYIADNDFFSNVDNQQNVFAGYVQYGNAIGKFQYFAGLRLESSNMDIKYVDTGAGFKKNYIDLFPTATLNYKFNDKNELQLSYSKRVRRPMGFMLNPFFSATDDRNVRYGNPDLDPTYTNSFELSYITNLGKLMITPSLFYQRTTDMINQFQRRNTILTEDEEGNQSYLERMISKPLNNGNEDRYGLDLTATYRPFRWWNLMLNVNLFGYNRTGYYQEYNEDINTETGESYTKLDAQDFSGDGFSSRGRLSSNFTLPADFKIQLAANYMGSMKTAQQKIEDNLSMDFSLSKDLFKNRATVSFNIRDVFDSRKREMTQYANDYSNYESMRWMVRSWNLSFTYRFKNTNEKDKRGKQQRPDSEEMGEGGEMGGF